MDGISDMICQLFQYYMQRQHYQISNIYVSTDGYLLQLINICQCSKNIQHYILDHTDLKKNQFTITNKNYCRHLCCYYVDLSQDH